MLCRCPNPKACGGEPTALAACAADWPACGNSSKHADMQCARGYHGNLCAQCADGFGMHRAFECRQCMPARQAIALYTLAAVLMLACMKCVCYFSLAQSLQQASGADAKPLPSHCIKALVLFFQYLLLISALDVDWPDSMSVPVQALACLWAPANPGALSLQCVLGQAGAAGLPQVTIVLLCLCVPVAMLLVLLLIEVLCTLQSAAAGEQRQ